MHTYMKAFSYTVQHSRSDQINFSGSPCHCEAQGTKSYLKSNIRAVTIYSKYIQYNPAYFIRVPLLRNNGGSDQNFSRDRLKSCEGL